MQFLRNPASLLLLQRMQPLGQPANLFLGDVERDIGSFKRRAIEIMLYGAARAGVDNVIPQASYRIVRGRHQASPVRSPTIL